MTNKKRTLKANKIHLENEQKNEILLELKNQNVNVLECKVQAAIQAAYVLPAVITAIPITSLTGSF